MRVAAIDCGTNSVKLLIADLDADQGLVERVRMGRMVRLGQGVDATGRLSPEALERTFGAVEEFAGVIADHGATAVRFCATSAARDAENSADFAAGIRARLDVEPEVLSGEEEARLSFAGATRGLPAGLVDGDGEAPVLVLDIGGGSTELVGGHGDQVHAALSLDVGSVRLTERHLHDDPPTKDQVAAAAADIESALDGAAAAGVDLAATRTLIGVAGTMLTVTAVALGHAAYDRRRLHHAWLSAEGCHAAAERLLALTVAERAALGPMHPGRADVIAAGALILGTVVRRTGVERVLASETDILDGMAWAFADHPNRTP